MIEDVTLTLFSTKAAENIDEKLIRQSVAKKLCCTESDINALILKKKSLDARHGKVKYHLRYRVFTGKDFPESENNSQFIPSYRVVASENPVIIVGSGPAGLFAALKLLEQGVKPIVIERGSSASKRKRSIAEISRSQTLNSDCNYCFGEGGAGMFSDGKLFTRSTKRGNPNQIYRVLHYFGASKGILTDAHPHIGTDILPGIIQNITAKIIELGGQVLFDTRCIDFVTDGKIVQGVKIQHLDTNLEEEIKGLAVILATGHSATDIYKLISKYSNESLEAKTFAMGVRVEHPRGIIDGIQYHGRQLREKLPAAEYRLITQVEQRGVYSFCMCPGGLVVPSATTNDGLVVNGMSPSSRSTKWSNSAVVVEVRPEDIPQEFIQGEPAFAGLNFRTYVEEQAKKNGLEQKAPCQRLTDFLAQRTSETLPESSYTPGLISSRLDLWLPKHISSRLKIGFSEFNKQMKGFITEQALLIAPETRTSTPVRILRNKQTYECLGLKGLYPAGEGSGYSGGIVSSAIDGEKVAEAILQRIKY
ncbi:MAG: FAD-dependent monooxygenase [Spirochaetaceae bacterium]|nr:FAD-dependent monooxygenase [Spirochaetaceae bacterium]